MKKDEIFKLKKQDLRSKKTIFLTFFLQKTPTEKINIFWIAMDGGHISTDGLAIGFNVVNLTGCICAVLEKNIW